MDRCTTVIAAGKSFSCVSWHKHYLHWNTVQWIHPRVCLESYRLIISVIVVCSASSSREQLELMVNWQKCFTSALQINMHTHDLSRLNWKQSLSHQVQTLQWQRLVKSETQWIFSHLKTKGFQSDAIEVSSEFLSGNSSYNIIFSYCKIHFSIVKNFLCNGKVSWMLKVLHGTICNTNNEPLFLKVLEYDFLWQAVLPQLYQDSKTHA